MIDLILDTNIWIHHIAKDNPKGIFKNLTNQINNGQVYLLSNEIIIDEWLRNKQSTIDSIVKDIKEQSLSALKIKEFLPLIEKDALNKLLIKYATIEEERINLAKQRVEKIEQLIIKSTKTPITKEMKLQVVDWALQKRAPFKSKNNSVGDALILLSAVKYREKQINDTYPVKSFFVSYNHDDYADKTNKNIIHQDLEDLLDRGNIEYKRNIGEVLNLTPELNIEIEHYIDMQIERFKEEKRGI